MQYNQNQYFLPRLSDFEEAEIDTEMSYYRLNNEFQNDQEPNLFIQAPHNSTSFNYIQLEPSIISEQFSFSHSLEKEEKGNSDYDLALHHEELAENESIWGKERLVSKKQSLCEILEFLETKPSTSVAQEGEGDEKEIQESSEDQNKLHEVNLLSIKPQSTEHSPIQKAKKVDKKKEERIAMKVLKNLPRRVSLLSEASDSTTSSEQQKPDENNSDKQTRAFACKHCGKIYPCPRTLGGHISKRHKGMSESYTKKINVREQRKHLRVALYLAKKLFQLYAIAPEEMTQKRCMVTTIRNIIVKTRFEDINTQDPEEEKSHQWYQSIVQEMLDGRHGRSESFRRTFKNPSNYPTFIVSN